MYKIIDKYIDKLMTSDPALPLWNVESIKQGKPARWNYIDGCMMTSLIELDELPELINVSDDKDRKELIAYQKVVASIYNKLQK